MILYVVFVLIIFINDFRDWSTSLFFDMALPIKKRPYTGAMSVSSKRLRRIEKQVYRNRPEMKTNTISVAGTLADDFLGVYQPCQIASGTGADERIADKIRLYRIEVRGTGSTQLDQYILQKKTTSNPTALSFSSAQGAYLLDSENTNRFTEWAHFMNQNVGSTDFAPTLFEKSFSGGILVKYNGTLSTSVVDNEIIVCILNRSGASRAFNLSIRIWYTDA